MINRSLLLKTSVSCLIFFYVFTGLGWSDSAIKTNSEQLTEQQLIAASKSEGEVESLESNEGDIYGVEGLWGMRVSFIIDRPADEVYHALTQIEKYPEYSEKVKRAEIVKRSSNGAVVDYAEGYMGFEMAATQEWRFDPEKLSIFVKNIGEEDSAAFQEVQVQKIGHPSYSCVTMTLFADTSWLPNFMLNWLSSMLADETVGDIRNLVIGILQSEKDGPNQK